MLGIDKDSFVLSYVGSLGGWYLTNEMLDFFAVLKKRYRKRNFFLFPTMIPGNKSEGDRKGNR